MEELIKLVEEWSNNKGLDKADPKSQFLKVAEEFGEIAAGLARNDMSAIEDGIGDTVVTLIILSQQLGLTLEQCLKTAYDEIEGRTGKLVNGVFVKSEDLKKEIDIYEIGKELLVKYKGQWIECEIIEGYRYKDGIVTVRLKDGEEVWFGEKISYEILKEK